jgi:hypothetical protein
MWQASALPQFAAGHSEKLPAEEHKIVLDIVLPLVDQYLKRKTAGASRFQVFVASKLAGVCRKAVHTRWLAVGRDMLGQRGASPKPRPTLPGQELPALQD